MIQYCMIGPSKMYFYVTSILRLFLRCLFCCYVFPCPRRLLLHLPRRRDSPLAHRTARRSHRREYTHWGPVLQTCSLLVLLLLVLSLRLRFHKVICNHFGKKRGGRRGGELVENSQSLYHTGHGRTHSGTTAGTPAATME